MNLAISRHVRRSSLPAIPRAPPGGGRGRHPLVLLHGPRQCGKTTLARTLGDSRGYAYTTLDDDVTLEAATADPVGFVDGLPERVILDEVQHAPGLFASLKMAVDRRRTAGRFLLTGSSNVLLLPTLADSLAGRMGIVRLHPLARCELAGRDPGFIDRLFGGGFEARRMERLGKSLADIIVAGGYPDALAAGQTVRLINVSHLAGPFQVSRPTIRDYVTLLQRVFLFDELPPWHSNRLSRLVKSPKLHVGDTGVACALLGLDADALRADRSLLGQLLETFVFQELRRQASWHEDEVRFHHFRDRDGVEVDIVLELGATRVAGIEVKASATACTRCRSGRCGIRPDECGV